MLGLVMLLQMLNWLALLWMLGLLLLLLIGVLLLQLLMLPRLLLKWGLLLLLLLMDQKQLLLLQVRQEQSACVCGRHQTHPRQTCSHHPRPCLSACCAAPVRPACGQQPWDRQQQTQMQMAVLALSLSLLLPPVLRLPRRWSGPLAAQTQELPLLVLLVLRPRLLLLDHLQAPCSCPGWAGRVLLGRRLCLLPAVRPSWRLRLLAPRQGRRSPAVWVLLHHQAPQHQMLWSWMTALAVLGCWMLRRLSARRAPRLVAGVGRRARPLAPLCPWVL